MRCRFQSVLYKIIFIYLFLHPQIPDFQIVVSQPNIVLLSYRVALREMELWYQYETM